MGPGIRHIWVEVDAVDLSILVLSLGYMLSSHFLNMDDG